MSDSAAAVAKEASAVELAQLQAQVEAARAVLIRLLQDTVEAETRLNNSAAAQLLEANEQLVVAAMRNQEAAETATQAMVEVTRSAELDGLTQLPNRLLLLDRLALAIAKARRHGHRVAVLFLDLDHFKQINDSQGHGVGDEVLKMAAQRMAASVREEDTVSRYGGDEFVILLSDIGHASDAIRVAEKVIAALAAPSTLPAQAQGWSASIGICLYPDDGDLPEGLIDCADRAMYRAKQAGRSMYALHGDLLHLEPLQAEAPKNEQEMRHALLREANEQLVIASLDAQALHAAAQQAQERQQAFLALVAQELGDPTAPIRIAGAMLGRNSGDEPLLPRIQALIDTQWQRMARLLGDVMDVSQAHAGQLGLVLARLNLNWLVSEAAASARPVIESRRQRLTLNLPTAPVFLNADAPRLLQVLCNLLDNASKYTPDGGELSVTVMMVPSGEAVVTTVADSGVGISAELLPRVFEPFAQDSRAIGVHGFSGSEVGMGLGLTVVHELVRAFGGTVAASSAGPGLGSEISVTLPLNL